MKKTSNLGVLAALAFSLQACVSYSNVSSDPCDTECQDQILEEKNKSIAYTMVKNSLNAITDPNATNTEIYNAKVLIIDWARELTDERKAEINQNLTEDGFSSVEEMAAEFEAELLYDWQRAQREQESLGYIPLSAE